MLAQDAVTPSTSNAHESTASTSAQTTAVSSMSSIPKRKAGESLFSDAKRRKLEDDDTEDEITKGDTTNAESKMLQQTARYARDVLQSSITRIHVVNLTVNSEFCGPVNDSPLKCLYR